MARGSCSLLASSSYTIHASAEHDVFSSPDFLDFTRGENAREGRNLVMSPAFCFYDDYHVQFVSWGCSPLFFEIMHTIMSHGELAFFQPHQVFFLTSVYFFIFWCFCMFLACLFIPPRMLFFSGWWLAFAFTGPPTCSNQPPQAGDARTFSKIGWVKIDIDNARSFKISMQRWSHILVLAASIEGAWCHRVRLRWCANARELGNAKAEFLELNLNLLLFFCWTYFDSLAFATLKWFVFGAVSSHGCIEMKISYLNSTLESFAGNLAQAKARQFDSTGAASGVLVGTRPVGWIWCRRCAVCSCVEVWPWSSLT